MDKRNVFSIDQDLLSMYLNKNDTNSQFGGGSSFHDDESDRDFNNRFY